MGIRRGRRVPTLIDPNNQFFYAGILLCMTFGFMLVGIAESYTAGDWVWLGIFLAGDAGLVAMYFWNVWCWLKFPDPHDRYDGVDKNVESRYGYDHRPGEHREP